MEKFKRTVNEYDIKGKRKLMLITEKNRLKGTLLNDRKLNSSETYNSKIGMSIIWHQNM